MSSIINATTTAGVTVTGDNSGSLQLATNNGTTAVTIDTSQNVGIGTTSPVYKLHVNTTFDHIHMTNPTTGTTGSDGFTLDALGTSARIIQRESAPMEFYTASTERMRITSGGVLLLNETSTAQSPLMQMTGSSATYNILTIKDTGTSYSTGARLVMFLNSSDSIAGVISHSGVTSVTYGTSSDQRLKENIVDAPNALDKVMDIKVRSYDWKEDDAHVEYGLVAQEVNQVYGEPIGVGGEDVKSEPWNIEYGRLTPILLKAIQELKAELDATKAEVQALKGVA
jgi:hypothetical protein